MSTEHGPSAETLRTAADAYIATFDFGAVAACSNAEQWALRFGVLCGMLTPDERTRVASELQRLTEVVS